MIEFLEPWADACARVLLERSIAFTIGVLVFVTTWWAFRRRLSASAGVWFLSAPYLFLLMPVERWAPRALDEFSPRRTIEDRLGLTAESDPEIAGNERDASVPPLAPRETGSNARPQSASEAPRFVSGGVPTAPPRAFPWTVALTCAWSFLAVGLLSILVWRQWRGQRSLMRTGEDAPHWLQRHVSRLGRVANVELPVRVILHDALTTPATFGFLRPAIVLPSHLIDTLSHAQLRWVLLHELSHVARRDVWTASLQRVLRIAFFFHPLIWLTDRLLEEQRECACDDRALDRCRPGPTRPFAEAFFEVIASANRTPRTQTAGLPLFDEKALLKRRLMRILNPDDPSRKTGTMTSLTLLSLATVVALTAARTPQDPPRPDVGWRPPTPVQDETPTNLVERARKNVDGCVRWLLEHQHADGHFTVLDERGKTTCPELNDVGATAYATMALMGARDFLSRDDLKSAVRKASTWLQDQQDAEVGAYGSRKQITLMLGHALATWCLARVEALFPDASRRDSLTKAFAFIEKARNPYRGWRYDFPPTGDNDTKITGLMLLAVHALQEIGLAEKAFQLREGGMSVIEELTDPATGRTGFTSRGEVAARLYQKAEEFPGDHSEELTAIALSVRMRFGQSPATSDVIRKGLALLYAKPPEWSKRRGSIDYSYWFYGSLALETVDDFQREHWNAIFLEDVMPHARTGENGLAHWPAVDAWSFEGGEVYATAVMALALEAVLRD
ncbi:MAG: M48 family metalloprotease [Planctomycetes bacterium]|nr:M48 family metalloprotease [Planctomycetota bacterium]